MSSPQVKFVLDAAWRRKWLLVLPPILGLTVGWAVVQRIPKLYTSNTFIVIEGARVPEKLLSPTVTQRIQDRLNILQELVKSPTYLDQVIKSIGMVSETATNEELEDVRGRLRSRISYEVDTRNYQWFKVFVSHEQPRMAAKAANAVAEIFIEENRRLRQGEAMSTEGFVAGMVEKRQAELQAAERALTEFRALHRGELPEDESSNLTQISTYQAQIAGLNEQIRARGNEIATLQAGAQTADTIVATIGGGASPVADPLARELQAARDRLVELRRTYSDAHPDVRRQIALVTDLEAKYEEQVLAGVPTDPSDPASTAGSGARLSPTDARILFLRTEIRQFEQQVAALQAKVDTLLARVSRIPSVSVQYSELQRAYDEARSAYGSVRGRMETAEQGGELEEAGLGERFRVQDRAKPVWTPTSPVVPNFLFGGAALGLLLGLGIAFLLEQLDPSLRTEERFRHAFPDVPLLEAIPSLSPDPMTAKGKRGTGGKGMKPGKGKAAAAVAVLLATGGLFW